MELAPEYASDFIDSWVRVEKAFQCCWGYLNFISSYLLT